MAWGQSWNNHGYAALSMSMEAPTDENKRLPEGGPARPGIFGDSAAPIKDYWMRHCVAEARLAAALLQNLPEVAPGKVGIAGCSCGGIIQGFLFGSQIFWVRSCFASIG